MASSVCLFFPYANWWRLNVAGSPLDDWSKSHWVEIVRLARHMNRLVVHLGPHGHRPVSPAARDLPAHQLVLYLLTHSDTSAPRGLVAVSSSSTY